MSDLELETRELLGVQLRWIKDERGAWDGPSREFQPLADLCLRHVRARRVVACAGGAMGMYPRLWRDYARFERVVTFEPDADNFSVLELNCPGDEYTRVNAALGAEEGVATLYRFDPSNRGMHSLTREAQGRSVEVRRCALDSLGLSDVDLIQLDVEGSELSALIGADATIRRCSPVITVETLTPDTSTLLTQHGYRQAGHAGSDSVFAPSRRE